MIQDKTVSLTHRPRRLRATSALRELVAQTHLRPQDFIAPYFVGFRDGRDTAYRFVAGGVAALTRPLVERTRARP